MAECDPFQQEDRCLNNLVTKAVQKDILQGVTIGQAYYNKERIVGPKNLWDKMSKVKLLTWRDASNFQNCEGQPTNQGDGAETNTVSLCTTADNCTHT